MLVRMTDPGRADQTRPSRGRRDTRQRRVQRPWQIVVAVLTLLAVVASVVAVFSDSVVVLRIGVVIALWAAVLAAIAMTRYRKDSESDAAKTRDLKLVYELQLEREIAARREYELVVETQVRRQVESQVRNETTEELVGLRREVEALRASLEVVFDSELPDERLAVRAEARRLQELDGGPSGLLAAQAADLPPLDEVTAAPPTEEGFQPDYEGYCAAAQEALPGMGDIEPEAPVDAAPAAERYGQYDGYPDHDGQDAEYVEDDPAPAEPPVAEEQTDAPAGPAGPADRADAGYAAQAWSAAPAADEHTAAAQAFDEYDRLPETGAIEARPAADEPEHEARGGRRGDGATVAELMARMRASGALSEDQQLGRRHRRAAD